MSAVPRQLSSWATAPPPAEMDEDVVASVRDVSKKFCKHLRRSMYYGILDLSRNLVGVHPDSTYLRKGEFWAVKDINFDLRRGEALGLIGRNGSGKTTLLRLLAGIFPPDKGEIAVRGRVGALISLGAGFHPHMTGRENIYLNGTILGMSRREVAEKFDQIVQFSELEEFIDTPVSAYSSGMRVRLGFAIAIHLDPDVVLIDEVLAVGDFAFRAKCLRRMDDLRNSGASIMFVSHHMGQISRLCDRAIVLERGNIDLIASPEEAVDYYIKVAGQQEPDRAGTGKARIAQVRAFDAEGRERNEFETGEYVRYEIEVEFRETLESPVISLGLYNSAEVLCAAMRTDQTDWQPDGRRGRRIFEVVIPSLSLGPETYRACVGVFAAGAITAHDWLKPAHKLTVPGGRQMGGVCRLEHQWRERPAGSTGRSLSSGAD